MVQLEEALVFHRVPYFPTGPQAVTTPLDRARQQKTAAPTAGTCRSPRVSALGSPGPSSRVRPLGPSELSSPVPMACFARDRLRSHLPRRHHHTVIAPPGRCSGSEEARRLLNQDRVSSS